MNSPKLLTPLHGIVLEVLPLNTCSLTSTELQETKVAAAIIPEFTIIAIIVNIIMKIVKVTVVHIKHFIGLML